METHTSPDFALTHPISFNSSSDLVFRPVKPSDLCLINRIVEQTVSSWGLPERVYRLTKPLLAYSETDLSFMRAILVLNAERNAIGTALWETGHLESAAKQTSSLFLHGLYVLPEFQRQGIGTRLIDHVSRYARKAGYNGIEIKAWRDSEPFFLRLGFNDLADAHESILHPRQLWRPA
jgi:GNAT superfamily N-acetyltransferase